MFHAPKKYSCFDESTTVKSATTLVRSFGLKPVSMYEPLGAARYSTVLRPATSSAEATHCVEEASPLQSQSAASEPEPMWISLNEMACPAGTLKLETSGTLTIVLMSGHAPATSAPAAFVQAQFAGSFTFERSPFPVHHAVTPVERDSETAARQVTVLVGVASVSYASAPPVPDLSNQVPETES